MRWLLPYCLLLGLWSQDVTRVVPLMGCEVLLRVDALPRQQAEAAMDAAVARMRDLAATVYHGNPASAIARLNAQAGRQPVAMPADIMALLQQSQRIGELSQGAFDITWLGAGRLWRLDAEVFEMPDAEAITAALARVDYRRLHLDLQAGTAYLPEAGMAVGLGGIAKGWIAEAGIAVLEAHGARRCLINAGGDVVCRNTPGAPAWRVGLRDPRGTATDILGVFHLHAGALMTSGDYERFVIKDGVRYCHIIDPRSGHPAAACRSVSIRAADGASADALATACFVLGPDASHALIASLPEVDYHLIAADGSQTGSLTLHPVTD